MEMVVPFKQKQSGLIVQVSTLRKNMKSTEYRVQDGNQKQPFFVVKEFSVGNSNLPKQSKCSSDKGSSGERNILAYRRDGRPTQAVESIMEAYRRREKLEHYFPRC